jgi:hypothetical protein
MALLQAFSLHPPVFLVHRALPRAFLTTSIVSTVLPAASAGSAWDAMNLGPDWTSNFCNGAWGSSTNAPSTTAVIWVAPVYPPTKALAPSATFGAPYVLTTAGIKPTSVVMGTRAAPSTSTATGTTTKAGNCDAAAQAAKFFVLTAAAAAAQTQTTVNLAVTVKTDANALVTSVAQAQANVKALA